MSRLHPTGPQWLTYVGVCIHIVWCNVKGVGDREILETYSNSASKNTSEIDIFPHGPKSLLTSVICVPQKLNETYFFTQKYFQIYTRIYVYVLQMVHASQSALVSIWTKTNTVFQISLGKICLVLWGINISNFVPSHFDRTTCDRWQGHSLLHNTKAKQIYHTRLPLRLLRIKTLMCYKKSQTAHNGIHYSYFKSEY